MKTLDDALSVAGRIPPDNYNIGTGAAWIEARDAIVTLGGHGFTPAILRRIADHLDPQADSLNHLKTSNGSALALIDTEAAYAEIRKLIESHPNMSVLTDGGAKEHRAGVIQSVMRLVGNSPVIPEGWRLVPVDVNALPEEQAVKVFEAEQHFRNGGCEFETLLAKLPTIPLRTEAEVRAEVRREFLEKLAAETKADGEYSLSEILDWLGECATSTKDAAQFADDEDVWPVFPPEVKAEFIRRVTTRIPKKARLRASALVQEILAERIASEARLELNKLALSLERRHSKYDRREARREALEEAARSIPDGWDVGNGSNTRVIEPGEARAAIRALIEKEPRNGDAP